MTVVTPAAPAPPPAAVEPRPGPVPRSGARAFLELERRDVLWLVGLVLLAFFLRAASPIFPDFLSRGLGGSPVSAWGLGFPYNGDSSAIDVPVGPNGAMQSHKGFVFDEVYFPVDAAKDLHQPAIDYFDPEPPLAKLLMAPPIAALGFGGWSWRLTCAIAGSLLVGLVYLMALRLRRRDRFFAVAAALFVCLDGLAFVESRTGVIDVIAIFFVALLYYAFLLHWQARTRAQWRATLYVMAAVAGLAFGAKLTAMAPTIVIAALLLGRALEPYAVRVVPGLRGVSGPRSAEAAMWRDAAGRRAVLHYAAAVLLGGVIFCACFARYLTVAHDQVYVFNGCSPQTGPTLARTDHQPVPVAHVGGYTVPDPVQAVRNIAGVMSAGLQYHNEECRGHPYASRWYTWPVMEHPVLFYADYRSFTTSAGSSETGWITDMGSPALWWPAIAAVLFCVWRMTFGPAAWRVGVGAVGIGSLVLMINGFHAAEQSTTVRVAPGLGFKVGLAGMVVFGALCVVSAVVSRRFVPAFLVMGYVAAWVMWVVGNERRVLFFYHMLGAVPFMALALAYLLTWLRREHLDAAGRRISLAPVAYTGVALALVAFIFFYPVWTGLPQTTPDHLMRIWTDGWQ